MKLRHFLNIEVDDWVGLVSLAMILTASAAIWLGTVTLTRGEVQEGGAEVSLRVGAGHGLDDAQQGGIDRRGSTIAGRPDGLRP